MTSGKHEPGTGEESGWAAVVSDGSALRGSGVAVDLIVQEFARHLGGLAQVPVRPVTLDATDAAQLVAGVRALPPDAGAVLLTHADPGRTRAAQKELRAGGARPVVTDQDATAIALTAALLGAVTGHGRRSGGLQCGRVVLAGARELPILAPLLVAAGFADLTLWNPADAGRLPLRNVVSGAHAVLDLVGGLPGWAAAEHDLGMIVITRGDAYTAPCAAAGLLRAALRTSAGAWFDVETYHTAALALAAAGAGWPVSHGKARALTHRVTDSVTQLFRTRQNTS
ncbi:hypothetical protein [Amycolatopsis sp. SID8362]|uniref:hypothetical protein n=1 Tax=Amycolatopsis sp. SID8362 TaxID=2690346 RepID=UPI0013722C6D|nr:hypothetical protein [Amycolatopsis sp. SID8362]NBH03522.1 hypothetical protein [Amycolatopsis sp. SID8362]NBH04627.1 hypothetical protein [Amycolatopsis sp. SID8362]NED40223.1 hypothetical protein [Amycolatopsis sp. SID8362]NED41327.1 hypothetical protein [Amycolatopsis sp. SID8362]